MGQTVAMSVTILIALLVCLAGLLVYLLTNGPAKQLGLVCFAVGLLVTLFALGGKVVHLGT